MAEPPKLRVETGPDAGKLVALTDGLLAGRGDDCGLVLPDPHCSRQHARFERANGSWLVADVGSTNGVVLNGQQVQGKGRLSHGSQVQIGHTTMTFLAPPADVPAAADRPTQAAQVRKAGAPRNGPRYAADTDVVRTVLFFVLLAVIFVLSSEVVRLSLKVASRP